MNNLYTYRNISVFYVTGYIPNTESMAYVNIFNKTNELCQYEALFCCEAGKIPNPNQLIIVDRDAISTTQEQGKTIIKIFDFRTEYNYRR